MANILIYDRVTGKPVQYLTSVNTPDYSSRSDVLVNPVIPAGVLHKYLKVVGGSVFEMTVEEKAAVDAAEAQIALNARIAQINNLDVSILDALIALVQCINVRIPNNPITKTEIITQIKTNAGI